MKAQHNISLANVVIPVLLVLGLVIGGSLLPQLVLAQEPDPPVEPDENELIDPPSEAELGEPVKDEAYVTFDDTTDDEAKPVDIFDLSFVAARYRTDDPVADINFDGTVNILDLALLASAFNRPDPPVEAAAIPTPEPLPVVEANSEFGSFDLTPEPEQADVESQGYMGSRPLRIGVALNYVKAYDYMDSYSPPDLYAVVRVGGVAARTSTIFNQYVNWPYWRLGWWRYYSFPYASPGSPEAGYHTIPINVELRDDDGYVCYGYYGCRYRYQLADISPRLYQRTKALTFTPGICAVKDEDGVETSGYWLASNRCRVYLQAWGAEWPRGYVSYYIDAWWE